MRSVPTVNEIDPYLKREHGAKPLGGFTVMAN